MKKFIPILIAIVLSFGLLTACPSSNDEKVVFYCPDGGPLLSVAKMMTDNVQFDGFDVEYNKAGSTLIASKILGGMDGDIFVAPINAGAKAYNANKSFVLGGVIAWGNSYIVANKTEEITSLGQLVGETLYAFQENSVPGITLKMIIEAAYLDYKVLKNGDETVDENKINLVFLADAAAIVVEMNKDSNVKYAVLPEPNATVVTMAATSAKEIAIDLQEIYQEQYGENYPQAGVFIRKTLVDNHKDFVTKFLAEVKKSADWTLENGEAAAALAKEKLASAMPAAAALTRYIGERGQDIMVFTSAAEAKNASVNYLTRVNSANPNMMGGTPDDGFYIAD
jgi:NitT/TauT family transport system substrate-binding protein